MPEVVLGEFEQLILLALARQGSEAYGVSIGEEIGARTGRDVSLGAVYKTLERLEDKGLVRSRSASRRPERRRRKKHYILAASSGARFASRSARRRMTDSLSGVEVGG
jgi:DNA-binding PadR family transcriptional regulator